jgi:predicted Zn-dependent protease
MTLHKILERINLPDADWVGLREVDETVTERSVRDGKPAQNSLLRSHGLMVEVLVRGQFAYAAVPWGNPDLAVDAANRAYELALHASPHASFRFSPAERPASKGKFHSEFKIDFSEKKTPELTDFLLTACERMNRGSKITRRLAGLRLVETSSRLVSSNGADIEQKFRMLSTNLAATAQHDGEVQTRSDGGLLARSHQVGLEALFESDLLDQAERVGNEAIELLSAEECPTTSTDLLLMPNQMMLQIHESIGHPLEIDRILGDERNYAGSSFVRLSDFGSLIYGSPLMNITFDPTVRGEFASYAFDDSGLNAEREFLIKGGKLLRGLGGMESQARSGLKGVANARASLWNRAPIDRMANINLEPGTATLDELISSIDNGILMESNRSWSIDDYRRKFQFGCEYGKWIKGGKIIKTIRNPNYRGISVPFWKSLRGVGNSATTEVCGTPYCGKGEPNQIIRVGHASPPCVFSDVEIFGGAS